jgi:hypothetical protein
MFEAVFSYLEGLSSSFVEKKPDSIDTSFEEIRYDLEKDMRL